MDFPEPTTQTPAPPANGASIQASQRPSYTVLLLGAVAVLVVISAGVGAYFALRPSAPSSPAPYTISAQGSVSLTGSLNWTLNGEVCSGTGKYADLHGGAKVTVSVEGHAASGALSDGGLTGEGVGRACTWTFEVDGVTQAAGPYRVEIANLAPKTVPVDRLGNIQLLI